MIDANLRVSGYMTGPRWEGIEIKVILDHLSRFLERVQGIRIGLTSLISDKRTTTLTNLKLTKQQPGEGNSLCGRGRKATDVEYFFHFFIRRCSVILRGNCNFEYFSDKSLIK